MSVGETTSPSRRRRAGLTVSSNVTLGEGTECSNRVTQHTPLRQRANHFDDRFLFFLLRSSVNGKVLVRNGSRQSWIFREEMWPGMREVRGIADLEEILHDDAFVQQF